MENKFNQEDKEQLVEFLNMVAKKANFNLNTQEIIAYFKLLSFMQTKLIPKLDANILEVIQVIESEEEKEE